MWRMSEFAKILFYNNNNKSHLFNAPSSHMIVPSVEEQGTMCSKRIYIN